MSVDLRRLTVVSAVGLGQLIAFGTSLYLLTTLAQPIVAETGWPLAWVVGGYSAGVLVAATVSALAGRYVGAGVAMSLGLYDVAFGTVGRLFGPSARASIIQIALWGGFASTTFWPLGHWLEGMMGWRLTMVVFAGLHLVVCLPLYLFAVPRPVDAAAVTEVRAAPAVTPRGDEWPVYLALGAVLTLEMSLVAMMSVHMHALLRSRGLTPEVAVALSACVGPSQVLARLLELTVGRRWPAYLSLCLGVVGVMAGIGLILASGLFALPGLIVYGAGLGVVSVTSGTVPLLVFGPERYPPLVGRLRRVSLVGQAIMPAGAAWVLGHWGPSALLWGLMAMAAVCLVAAVLLAGWSHGAVSGTS
ncbi:MAG: hypothetical protein JF615_10540 [Asticcacaulis sp.]|nr:hypothetical protein [Asticcacaulis sp.]